MCVDQSCVNILFGDSARDRSASIGYKMAGEKPVPSKVDSTSVDVKYEDIAEQRRKQFEAAFQKEQEDANNRLLACFGKTRQGVFKKEEFSMPTFTPPPPNSSTTATAAASSASTTSDVSFFIRFH